MKAESFENLENVKQIDDYIKVKEKALSEIEKKVDEYMKDPTFNSIRIRMCNQDSYILKLELSILKSKKTITTINAMHEKDLNNLLTEVKSLKKKLEEMSKKNANTSLVTSLGKCILGIIATLAGMVFFLTLA